MGWMRFCLSKQNLRSKRVQKPRERRFILPREGFSFMNPEKEGEHGYSLAVRHEVFGGVNDGPSVCPQS